MDKVKVCLVIFLVFSLQNVGFSQDLSDFEYWYLSTSDDAAILYGLNPVTEAIIHEISLPVELSNLNRVLEAALSPNGNQIAYVTGSGSPGSDYNVNIYEFGSDTITSVSGQFVAIPTTSLDKPRRIDWVSETDLLIRSYESEAYQSEFYVYQQNNIEPRLLKQALPDGFERVLGITDKSSLVAFQTVCPGLRQGCSVIAERWSVDPLTSQEQYEQGDFSERSADGLCELTMSPDNRYIAYVSQCYRTALPDLPREVYVYDTQTGQRNQVTRFTEGTTLDDFYTASYTLHWDDVDSLIVSVDYSNASGDLTETYTYHPVSQLFSLIEPVRHTQFENSPSESFVALRSYTQNSPESYTARIVDTQNGNWTTLYEEAIAPCHFHWSPDDIWLAYAQSSLDPGVCNRRFNQFHFYNINTMQSYTFPTPGDTRLIPLGWRESAASNATATPEMTTTPAVTQDVTLIARIGGNDNEQQTEFGYQITNTGSSPQGDLSTQIFFSPDAGRSYTDYTLDLFYDSSNAASVSGPVQWDANTAYFVVTYGTSTLASGGMFEFQGQLRFTDYAFGYDSSNDWWRVGLTGDYTATDNIPVYGDGTLLSGQEPDGSTIPTATPAPPTPTPTLAPTVTPDATSTITVQSRLDGQNDNQQATFRYRLLNTGSAPVDNLSLRLFFTLEGSYSASDYVLDVFYDQSSSATVTGPFQHNGDVYYFQIDYGIVTLQPNRYWEFNAGLRLQNYAVGLDSSNDWWATGITDTLTDTIYMPVYANGSRVTGQEPTQ